jgi:phenazine biosynthesis protein phzE
MTEYPAGLDSVLDGTAPAYALVHRPHSTEGPVVDVLVGSPLTVRRLADLPMPFAMATDGQVRYSTLAAIPYRQIVERGYECHDDEAPIRVVQVHDQQTVSVAEALRRLPRVSTRLGRAAFDLDDDRYADVVRRVVSEEIGRGAGANFVIARSFTAQLHDYRPAVVLDVFRRLLTGESGAYWTFLVHTGDTTFVGASPERHVTLSDGRVVMNPISGTYRYPAEGPRLAEVLEFLSDRKEIDELYMVVDEELKMMARVCPDGGGQVLGPYLRPMARLAHTEYLIRGRTDRDARDVLRETLFAPTVTGSPIENACRVIARHEPVPRGYYSGVLALLGRDRTGDQVMDTAIMIRTAEIDRRGSLRLGVGSTVVRLSDPASEAAETRAKAEAMLGALGLANGGADRGPARPRTPPRTLVEHPEVAEVLRRRNDALARFWLDPVDRRHAERPALTGRRVLVVDAEDTFTAMLAQQLHTIGLEITVVTCSHAPEPAGYDAVVLGPGPGDPTDRGDPRVAALDGLARRLLRDGVPFLAVCLSHQVVAGALGLPVRRRATPNQGVQLPVPLFGRQERVGFYNTFVAYSATPALEDPYGSGTVRVGRHPADGEVFALRGKRFASVQFHPESLLTRNGPEILADVIESLVARAAPYDLVSTHGDRRLGG